MPWFNDVTDRTAVLKAIEEFDLIGREEFLQKYHFQKTRRYYVLHKGGVYDCKPLLCGAYNHQYKPSPLLTREGCASSGTVHTVKNQLETLGFDVRDRSRP